MHTGKNDFEYDAYGNMIVDRNKKITNITYNHLSLPKKITFENMGVIEYLYAADGSKLKKTVTEGTTNKTVDYLDGYQYTNEKLEFFPTAEGYVKFVSNFTPSFGSFHYVYNYMDHLGNIRLRYTKDPQTGEIEPLEENHYYPFGLKHDGYTHNHQIFEFDPIAGNVTIITIPQNATDGYNYKFGGMEQQTELGLEFYDFGARNYDAALGRWMNVDPLAEEFPSWNPYHYVHNNPINMIDPDGRSGEPVIDNENKTVTIHSKLYFYGSEANSDLSEKIATGIASQWNAANAKTEVDGIEYDVKFRISYETVSVEEAIELAENNNSLRNNFIRVEKGEKDKSSFFLGSEQGGNSFWFNTNDELDSSTTPAHEYGHGLGLPHPKVDLSEAVDRPHIMIPRNKAYGSYWSIKNDRDMRVINPNARRVTPQNVSDALKNKGGRIHNRIISKDGKQY